MLSQSITFAIATSTLWVLLAAGNAFAQAIGKLNIIADSIQKGEVVAAKKQAAAYANANPLPGQLMAAFGKRGLGVGGKGSIEIEIHKLAKAPVSLAELKSRSADLVRMTEHVTAIGFISESYGIKIPVKKDVPYTKLSNDLVAAVQGLNAAVTGQNPAAVQKSAAKVLQSCVACHSIYKE